MANRDIRSMTTEELVEWLKSEGIPEEFCVKFEGMFPAELKSH